jgi:hypothetical protein
VPPFEAANTWLNIRIVESALLTLHCFANYRPARMMDSQAKTVGFLHLPPEIRNQIYHNVLSEPRGLFLNSLQRPPLLATCRQIQREPLPILFPSNRFEFHLSRPYPACDPNMILKPQTGMFLRNVQAHMTHIVSINVHATIRYELWNGFFTTFRIRIRGGHVYVELDVTKLIGRARSLCVPILSALDERIIRMVEFRHSKALGFHDLETLVDIFRPHLLNGLDICFVPCYDA